MEATHGTLLPCSTITPGQPGYGQDGHFPSGSLSYTDKGDGSVLDNLTGLVWSKEPDAEDVVNWNTANATCLSKGWHLPTPTELLSLVDYSRDSCLWDAVFGASCTGRSAFWTSVPRLSSSAFFVSFEIGSAYNCDVSDNLWVRCVRAGQANPTDEQRFVDLGETVFDRLTGLEWEKVPLDSFNRTWVQALSGCLNSKKAGGGWRLPNVKEIYSIMEIRAEGTGCQWNNVFQGDCRWYWTSTPALYMSSNFGVAYGVDFQHGKVDMHHWAKRDASVRCVRSCQK